MNGGTEKANGEQLSAMQRLEAAGWEMTGDIAGGAVAATFQRRPDSLAVAFTDTVYRLGMLDRDMFLGDPVILGEPSEADKEAARAEEQASTDGMSEPPEKPAGYRINRDSDTDTLVLAYDGPANARFSRFVDDMVAWGDELEARQTAALEHEPMLSWAVLASRRYERQLARLEEEHWPEAGIEADSKRRIFGEVVSLALSNGAELEPADQRQAYLEALFAWTVRQQRDRAAEQGLSDVEAHPDFDVLAGIARAANLELVRARELSAIS
jgi:hypothetical protein